MNNKYYKRSKITEAKFRQIVKYFAMNFTATDTAHLTRLSRRSVTDIFGRLREKILQWCQLDCPLSGVVEVDESG